MQSFIVREKKFVRQAIFLEQTIESDIIILYYLDLALYIIFYTSIL